MNTTPITPHLAARFLKSLMEAQWRKPGVGSPLQPATWAITRAGLVVDNEPYEDEDED